MLNKNWLINLLLLISLLSFPLLGTASPPSQADDEMLDYGNRVTHSLVAGETHQFSFQGQQGDVVNIQVQGQFPNTLTLYTSTGVRLTQNNNASPDVVDSRIGHFILPTMDTYTLEVTNNSQAVEQYTLMLDGGAYAVIPIQFGETTSHLLTENPVDIWTFSGSANDTISIYVEADFDPYLELYAPGSQLLVGTRSARAQVGEILNFTLEHTGIHRLAVSYFGDAGGEYTVQLEGVGANFWILENGREVNTTFVTTDPHQWTLVGEAGEYVTIGTFGNLDTSLQLYYGETYIASDDNLFGHNAYLRDIELPESGIYTLYVWDNTFSLGEYSIRLRKKSHCDNAY